MKKTLTIISLSLAIAGCNNPSQMSTEKNDANLPLSADYQVGLHTQFKDSFMIGTALAATDILSRDDSIRKLVAKEFNAVTAENVLKWELVHPKPNVYDFKAPDRLVDFAEKNNIFLVGHTLVWHHQRPDWIFENNNGSTVSREVLLSRMEEHINKVAGRYKNRIDAWDVVNEALEEDGSLRESAWFKIIGEDYIEQAFRMAEKAAPNAKLYYNDYNLFEPEKRDGAIKLIKNLQAKGVKIDGIGLQGHYGLYYPDLNQFEDSIKAFTELGIDIFISELDITVLPLPGGRNQGADIALDIALDKQSEDKMNPYPKELPAVIEAKLGERYQEIFSVLNKYKDHISRVSLWGISDAHTWRNDWPVKGRTDYPLFFDRNMNKKPFVSRLSPTE
jgi:endo-1,4-beta-xylanase